MDARSINKIKNRNIIRQMWENGATIEEMMEATGYQYTTVIEVIREFRAEVVQVEHLTLAKHPKPNMPIVEFQGKKYRDVTDAFLSSEWEGIEDGTV